MAARAILRPGGLAAPGELGDPRFLRRQIRRYPFTWPRVFELLLTRHEVIRTKPEVTKEAILDARAAVGMLQANEK